MAVGYAIPSFSSRRPEGVVIAALAIAPPGKDPVPDMGVSPRRPRRFPALICCIDSPFLDFHIPSVAQYHMDCVKSGHAVGALAVDVIRHGAGRSRHVKIVPAFGPGQTLASGARQLYASETSDGDGDRIGPETAPRSARPLNSQLANPAANARDSP